ALVEELWTRVVKARAGIEEVTRLKREHLDLETSRTAAEHDDGLCRKAHDQALAASNSAIAAATEAIAALSEAQTRHQAAALRPHLHVGDNCPVCLQEVIKVPSIEPPPELASLTKQRDVAQLSLEQVKRSLQTSERKLAVAGARLEGANAAATASSLKVADRV